MKRNFFFIKQHAVHQGGFSLLELLVAIAIFIILSSTFLMSYNTFNKRISVDTLAQQIGQWVRDAQVSAMSVKHAKTQAGVFPGYGLHFSILTPDRFVYFADLDSDLQYDPPLAPAKCGDAGVECEREVVLLKGNTILALCGDAPSGSASSPACGLFDASNSFDISFTRPNPDAFINGDLLGVSFPTTYARARIIVTSVSGYQRTVEGWTTGQVSIQ
jgi:prepilin-type N-terminal cleavage/methylation domain-containing protein